MREQETKTWLARYHENDHMMRRQTKKHGMFWLFDWEGVVWYLIILSRNFFFSSPSTQAFPHLNLKDGLWPQNDWPIDPQEIWMRGEDSTFDSLC